MRDVRARLPDRYRSDEASGQETAPTIRIQSGPVVPRTKAALIETLAAKAKLPLERADALVNGVFDCMADALARGEGVEIRGFGSFSVRSHGGYDGRNPRSGEPVHVKPKRLPFFRVGKELRERVSSGRGGK